MWECRIKVIKTKYLNFIGIKPDTVSIKNKRLFHNLLCSCHSVLSGKLFKYSYTEISIVISLNNRLTTLQPQLSGLVEYLLTLTVDRSLCRDGLSSVTYFPEKI